MFKVIIFSIILAIADITSSQLNLKQVSEWQEMEFLFPTQELRDSAINEGKYKSGSSVPIDVDVYYREQGSKIFVTIPRFLDGVPITLGTVSSSPGNGGPMVKPYPDYAWHVSHGADCNGFTSVFRVAIDVCNRLWVLDTGRIGATQHCQPQLVVFNLENDKEIHRYKFSQTEFKWGTSLFITPVVDVRDPPPGKCRNTMVYIADVNGFGLVVYDYQYGTAWRVQNKLMFPVPQYGTYTVSGETFDLMDGIFGLALSPARSQTAPRSYTGFFGNNYLGGQQTITQNDRLLYFHALASITENSIPLRIINNQTMWTTPDAAPRAFIEIGSRNVQSPSQAMDRNGNLFFGLLTPNAIACWDSSTPYDQNNMRIVAQDEDRLQFASGLKIIVNRRGEEELWVLTSRIQKFLLNTYDVNEVNFRILALPIQQLLGGTKCTTGSASGFSFPAF